jgi:hypothetical protein
MLINLDVRRRDVQTLIDSSPWEITINQRGRKRDDAETSFALTGTISPASNRLAPELMPTAQVGEIAITRQVFIMLAGWQEPTMARGDEVIAISPGQISHTYEIVSAIHYDEKWEVLLYENQ